MEWPFKWNVCDLPLSSYPHGAWRRKWQSTPVFLPGKSHGQGRLVDYRPWGLKESDTTAHTCPMAIYVNMGPSESRSSVQFSCSVVSDSLRPYESQHTRPLCPSPTPRVYPNSCPLSPTSSSVVPFSSSPQSFPASGSFPISQLFASGGQSVGVSAST